jgi:Rad51
MMDGYLLNKDESNIYLKNIAYKRIYELGDLLELLKKIRILNFDLIVIDDVIPMFTYKFKDNTRLEVRRFIRDLSMVTLSRKLMIVFTNTVTEKRDKDGKNIQLQELFFHDIIRYVHYKFYLQINPYNKKITECKLIHPYIVEHAKVYINLNNF